MAYYKAAPGTGVTVQRVLLRELFVDSLPHGGRGNFQENCAYLFEGTQNRKNGLSSPLNVDKDWVLAGGKRGG